MSTDSPIDWGAVRAAYESGQGTIKNIAEHFSVTVHAISYRAKKEKWRRRRKPQSQKPKRKSQNSVIQRLYRTIDRKLAQLEAHMTTDDDLTIADHERETRALGQLIRNFEKVSGLEADQHGSKHKKIRKSDDDTEVAAVDPERLRNELAERILRLREIRQPDNK